MAEASAGVAMAGIPVVNIHGVDGQRQQEDYGARQMSVDMMDVSGLSLTGQGNERQGADAAMREKMEAAQLQVRTTRLLPSDGDILTPSFRHSKRRRPRNSLRSRLELPH